MSEQSDKIYNLLKQAFPFFRIEKEYYVYFKGTRLFFDFFIKELWVAVEVQGRQHSEFVQHFHGDRDGFIKSKRRDNLKKEYCDKAEIDLMTINYDEDMTKEEIMDRIFSVVVGEK